MRECGFARFTKDEGEPGPLGGQDLWVGEDVHIDIPGGDRRNRKRQGIAAAPSVHKAADCPDGEHRHDRFDYCHPEERKHRGGAKAEGPKRPYPPYRTAHRQAQEAFREWYYARRDRKPQEEIDKLLATYNELKDLANASRRWEASPQGKAWVNQEKVKRAKGQGLKSREDYEEKAAALQEKLDQLEKEHDRLYEKYAFGATLQERQAYVKPINENVKQQKSLRTAIKRAQSMSTLSFAREWTGIIQEIAGGVEPHITAIRVGGRAFAEYGLEDGIISLSPSALKVLEKVRNDPDILWRTGPNLRPDRAAFAVASLVHEFLHSVNTAKDAYKKGGPTQLIEEGLTEAIAIRMVARPDVLSKLLGKKVDKGITSKPDHPSYVIYTNTMEYLAELAAQRANSEPEWFLGKWKFHTDPVERPNIILGDVAGAGNVFNSGHEGWNNAIREAREKLPKMKEERLAQRENKAFQGTVQKVLDSAWSAVGFVFKNDTWPPQTPAPTGGGGGGPMAAPGSLVPAGMDVRHTGSPPKGVKWQKLPRQGGQAPGGGGAGAIQGAMKKHDTPRSPHRLHDPRTHEYSEEHTVPLLDEFIDSEVWIKPTCSSRAAAQGQCADISVEFYDFLKQNGIESELIELEDFTGHGETEYAAHTVVKVGDRYVDWTARQLDPDAPVPLVLDEKELVAYWGRKQKWTEKEVRDHSRLRLHRPRQTRAIQGAIRAARTYVEKPADAPAGTQTQRGPRGGIYYETEGDRERESGVFYHGTNRQAAALMEQQGFGTEERIGGMAPGAPLEERGLTFLTPSKRAAHWFAHENFNAPQFGGPAVIKVSFDGRVLRIPKATSIYDAARALEVKLLPSRRRASGVVGSQGYSFKDFRRKLAAAGYDAVAFSDKHAGGREALAVFNTASLRFGGSLAKATMDAPCETC